MVATIVILSLLLVGACWLAFANYRKYVKAVEYAENGFFVYNSFLASLYHKFQDTINTMNVIDHRGSFKADDEVGAAFESLKDCVEELDEYIKRYVQTEEEKN